MLRIAILPAVLLATILSCPPAAMAQEWEGPVRGSWVRDGEPEPEDVMLVDAGGVAEIVLAESAGSIMRRAAEFLAGDIEKITGQRPAIVPRPSGKGPFIRMMIAGEGAEAQLPEGIDSAALAGKWEAHQILTAPDGLGVYLVGSDPRGAAFAAYTLSERLGIDPLHHWTGFVPQRRERLVMKRTDYSAGSPTFRYRGLFHDDEDILPRPFEYAGYPLRIGDVPLAWYEKFFETALRLRMNMVAPYTRVHRRFEVQKTASDWGLYYTSHHYDILLSNPFGYERFGLAKARGVEGKWDWLTNRDGMLRYWRGGVEENGSLDAIWPVGLRGTDDYAYPFPEGMSEQEQNRIFQEVIGAQIEATRQVTPPQRGTPVFHFTLYGEMLDKYLAAGGGFDMPASVILIWPDDNDGRMRALPQDRGQWKHGVYYHAAYYGPVAKQSMHLVPPDRIATEFKRIVEAGATEYMLLNVSELREFVMEARLIAEICWDAKAALEDTPAPPPIGELLPHVPTAATRPVAADIPSPSAQRFIRWWAREYFGEAAGPDAAEAYRLYGQLLDRWDKQWLSGDRVHGALRSLQKRFAGEAFEPARPETLPMLEARAELHEQASKVLERARSGMDRQQRQFFFEHVELPMLIDRRGAEAAILLIRAMSEPDDKAAWALVQSAMAPLEQLEIEILRAERPPFEGWYRKTWIRHEESGLNIHRPYEDLRAFIATGGTQLASRPDPRPDILQFVPLLKQRL